MQSIVNKNILLLGARAPIALEIARSFKNEGYTIILADSLRFPVARWSNTILKYERLPAARQETKSYIDAIKGLISKYTIRHLIPTCEEAFYIAKYKSQFNCKVWTSDLELMNLLHNKESFAQKFKDQLPIPKTTSLDKFTKWSESEQYVFKPKYSRFGNQIIINTTITKETITNPENWIAQKKVTGLELCIYSIWDAGKLKGYSCYSPLYKIGKGSSIFFRHIENLNLKELVKNFGASNLYTGQLSFDVIISADSTWFIECNPRGTSGAHLLNKDLAKCFLENEESIYIGHHDFMLTYLMFFTHPLKFLNKKVRKAKDVIYRANDALPAFLQILSLYEMIFIKFSKGIDLLESTTFDIEWNGNED